MEIAQWKLCVLYTQNLYCIYTVYCIYTKNIQYILYTEIIHDHFVYIYILYKTDFLIVFLINYYQFIHAKLCLN